MGDRLAFDLMLLGWNDQSGKPHSSVSQGLPAGVGGALLLEGALAEVITVADGRVHATGRIPEDPLLTDLVADVTRRRRPPKAKTLVSSHRGHRRLKAVRDRMVRDGVLHERAHRVLGLFPTTRRHPSDPEHAEALRGRVTDLLTGVSDPEAAADDEVALAALAGATGALDVLVSRGERREAKQRAKRFADGDGISEAVGVAVREVQAAAVAAAAGAASASAGGSG